VLLDRAHRRVDLGADVGRLGKGQQAVEACLRRELEDALGVVGGGIIDAAAAPGRGAGLLQLHALRGEANFRKAQEDQAEEGAGVFLGLEPRVGAELIDGVLLAASPA
jgi:hypothetical protein